MVILVRSHHCIICTYLSPGWCGNDAPQTIIYLVTGLSRERYFTEDTSDLRELGERGGGEDLSGRGRGEELREGYSIIRIHCVRKKISVFNRRKKVSNRKIKLPSITKEGGD